MSIALFLSVSVSVSVSVSLPLSLFLSVWEEKISIASLACCNVVMPLKKTALADLKRYEGYLEELKRNSGAEGCPLSWPTPNPGPSLQKRAPAHGAASTS